MQLRPNDMPTSICRVQPHLPSQCPWPSLLRFASSRASHRQPFAPQCVGCVRTCQGRRLHATRPCVFSAATSRRRRRSPSRGCCRRRTYPTERWHFTRTRSGPAILPRRDRPAECPQSFVWQVLATSVGEHTPNIDGIADLRGGLRRLVRWRWRGYPDPRWREAARRNFGM